MNGWTGSAIESWLGRVEHLIRDSLCKEPIFQLIIIERWYGFMRWSPVNSYFNYNAQVMFAVCASLLILSCGPSAIPMTQTVINASVLRVLAALNVHSQIKYCVQMIGSETTQNNYRWWCQCCHWSLWSAALCTQTMQFLAERLHSTIIVGGSHIAIC